MGPALLAVEPPRAGERTMLDTENVPQSIAVPEPFSLSWPGHGRLDPHGFRLDDQVVRGQFSAHCPQARIHNVDSDDDPLRLDEGEQAWSVTLGVDGPGR